MERLKHVSALSVVNVETGEAMRLGDLESVYSKEWLEYMMGAATD